MLEKLTKEILAGLIVKKYAGHIITNTRLKGGNYSDSDCYGVILARKDMGVYGTQFATWEFNLRDGELNGYWGHYFMDEEKAMKDYRERE